MGQVSRFVPIRRPRLHRLEKARKIGILPFLGKSWIAKFRTQLRDLFREGSLVVDLIMFHAGEDGRAAT